jgi:uncharacterized protein (TIGR03086 family)
MSTAPYEQAIASTRSMLASVKPDQLALRTPCASWKVSDVINHVVGGQYFFASAMSGTPMSGEAPDFAAGDFVGAFDEGARQTLSAFQADGAMSKTVKLPFGEMPGAAFVGIAATDTFVHGWDLARAIGASTDLNPALATQLLAGAKMAIPDAFRGPDGVAPFGAEQKAPAGASAADELAAFLGREV